MQLEDRPVTIGDSEAAEDAAKPELQDPMFAIARRLMKTNTINPVVSSQSIGPRAARIEKILAKYSR